MFKYYLIIAFRNFRKHKAFAVINILGLSVGMAIAMLSLLYVINEFSFDRFHEKKERIYRLIAKTESAEGTETSAIMTAGVGPSFLQEVPEVENMTRISNPRNAVLTFQNENFNVQNLIYADSSFFNIFTFPLNQGNPEKALDLPYQIVLTESTAGKIFGNSDNTINKMVRLNDRDNLRITGVMEDTPINSHLRFGAVVSFSSLYQDPGMFLGWNGGWNYFTYFLMSDNADLSKVEKQFTTIADKNINNQLRNLGVRYDFFLQPLKEVHLNSNVGSDIATRGSVTSLWLTIAITFVILLVACINFINLTTAASLTRMKEVGMRKVSGAGRIQIILQFLTETLLISVIALAFSFILIELFNFWLPRLTADTAVLEKFRLYNKSFYQVAFSILFMVITVGIIAGAYSSFLMSGFNPALSLKGRFRIHKGSPLVRNLLVVFQFSIAIILIISTLVVAFQLQFLVNTDKGFEPSSKIVIPLKSKTSRTNAEILKQEFLSIPGVEKAGASSEIPGNDYTSNGYIPEGHKEPLMFHALDIDYDYLDAMDLEIVRGKRFSKSFGRDEDAYMINQTLARQLGWDNPVGKTIIRNGPHKIIGVVKDYNYSPLDSKIEPLIITLKPWRGYDYITLKITGRIGEIKSLLEGKWKPVVPNEDFTWFSLSTYVAGAYKSIRDFMFVLLLCSALAIVIASLGLFGLAAFMTRQRTREIAVRKIFGAQVDNIFFHVSVGFLKWVLIANLLAWPVAYLLMSKYLQNFVFNTGISVWVFLVVLIFTCILSVLVIFYQVLRLIRLNPVDYIRYE